MPSSEQNPTVQWHVVRRGAQWLHLERAEVSAVQPAGLLRLDAEWELGVCRVESEAHVRLARRQRQLYRPIQPVKRPHFKDRDGGDPCSEIKEERAVRGKRGTFAEGVTPIPVRGLSRTSAAQTPGLALCKCRRRPVALPCRLLTRRIPVTLLGYSEIVRAWEAHAAVRTGRGRV